MPFVRCAVPEDAARAWDACVAGRRTAAFLVFGGTQPDTGVSWCPDCTVADPVLRGANQLLNASGVLAVFEALRERHGDVEPQVGVGGDRAEQPLQQHREGEGHGGVAVLGVEQLLEGRSGVDVLKHDWAEQLSCGIDLMDERHYAVPA